MRGPDPEPDRQDDAVKLGVASPALVTRKTRFLLETTDKRQLIVYADSEDQARERAQGYSIVRITVVGHLDGNRLIGDPFPSMCIDNQHEFEHLKKKGKK